MVRPDQGDPVVVQWTGDRRGMARRIRMGHELPRRDPSLPLAKVLDGDSGAAGPFMVTRFVEGESGRALIADDEQAGRFCRQMGELAGKVRRVPVSGLQLSTTWGRPARLELVARRWLDRADDLLGPNAVASVHNMLLDLPRAFGSVDPAFAHGDFAPVNVIVRDGSVAALLDLERTRIAHPWFDAAWFRLIVRGHHPSRWKAAGSSFLSAAGIGQTAEESATLDLLAVLQCLELIGGAPRPTALIRSEWAARARDVLARATRTVEETQAR